MELEYIHKYRQRPISYLKLLQQLTKKYQDYPLKEPKVYDQMLFLLDQKSPSTKCNRSIARQLFVQATQMNSKCSIQSLLKTYIQNLQTAKICLQRDEYKLAELRQSANSVSLPNKTHVFLQVLQASAYSRFSPHSNFAYQIVPSDLPLVTMHTVINPNIKQQFVLELEVDYFQILFFESGIQIYRWRFPDEEDITEGQYTRLIRHQNITFELKFRYFPAQSPLKQSALKTNQAYQEQKVMNSRNAFIGLCEFQPFLCEQNKVFMEPQDEDDSCLSKMASCFPCLGSSVRNLYYCLILMLIAQCWHTFYTSLQMVDMMAAIYTIGLLYDRRIKQFKMYFIVIVLSLLVCLLKTFWSISKSSQNTNSLYLIALIVSTIVEVLVILSLLLTLLTPNDIARQRTEVLFDASEEEKPPQDNQAMQIWQSKESQFSRNFQIQKTSAR